MCPLWQKPSPKLSRWFLSQCPCTPPLGGGGGRGWPACRRALCILLGLGRKGLGAPSATEGLPGGWKEGGGLGCLGLNGPLGDLPTVGEGGGASSVGTTPTSLSGALGALAGWVLGRGAAPRPPSTLLFGMHWGRRVGVLRVAASVAPRTAYLKYMRNKTRQAFSSLLRSLPYPQQGLRLQVELGLLLPGLVEAHQRSGQCTSWEELEPRECPPPASPDTHSTAARRHGWLPELPISDSLQHALLQECCQP